MSADSPSKPTQQNNSAKAPQKPDENPLINLALNVILPVLILSKFSPAEKAWVKMEPQWAMLLAVSLPLGYGIWHFIKTRKANFLSILGLVAVLATGLLSLYLYNEDGTVKSSAAQLFAIKEALIPLLLGAAVFLSHWSKTPLLRLFLYQPELFDIPRIEAAVSKLGREQAYQQTLLRATGLFAFSFVLSAIANYFLAIYFLQGIESDIAFNEAIAKLTLWGFVVIAAPLTLGLVGLLFFLRSQLAKVANMHPGEVLLIG